MMADVVTQDSVVELHRAYPFLSKEYWPDIQVIESSEVTREEEMKETYDK